MGILYRDEEFPRLDQHCNHQASFHVGSASVGCLVQYVLVTHERVYEHH